MEKATFAAGCFWGIETAYRRLEGVLDVAVGYEGGSTDNPSCMHWTDWTRGGC